MVFILNLVIPLFMLLPLTISTGSKKESKDQKIAYNKQAAIALLKRAPNLKPLPANALNDKEFISLARSVAYSYSHKPVSLNTINDAIAFLERLLKIKKDRGEGVGWPRATMTSEPSGWSVRYRGYIDHIKNRGDWQNAKTNTARLVEPKLYIFQCTKDNGKPCGEMRVSCATDCQVDFPYYEK